MKNNDQNAKNPKFRDPVHLPHVKPEDYDSSIDSGRGSAKAPAREQQKKHRQLPLNGEEIGGA